LPSPTWYGWVNGDAVPLCSNKAAAEIMLGNLLRKAAMGDAGAVDPFEEHRGRPLAEHLDEFEAELRTKVRRGKRRPPSPRQVALKVGRIRAVLNGCGFAFTGDITLQRVQEFLAGLASQQTAVEVAPEEQDFTLKRVAEVLGIKRASVAP